MPKRSAAEALQPERATKARRTEADRLSALTDELLLRILANVSPYTLTVCQEVNRRLHSVAGDSQLWKIAYYDRFVRPRAQRLPSTRSQPVTLRRSSKLSKWLDEGHLVRSGQETNWKRQYKLRHNWSRGVCGISEMSVTDKEPAPPLLAKLHRGTVFAVDAFYGLRAFSYKDKQALVASEPLQRCLESIPTALAVDTRDQSDSIERLAIGFEDGAFATYNFDSSQKCFQHSYVHAASSIGMVTAVAFSWPYLLTMSHAQTLSLYKFPTRDTAPNDRGQDGTEAPVLLASLKSQTVWSPLSLSLRLVPGTIVASVAYSVPTFSSGWTAGVQELRISYDGDLQESRIASAVNQPFQSLSMSRGGEDKKTREQDGASGVAFARPTSLSYSHPYLLCCHADNTLTLYLVKSSQTGVTVSAGKRLWGHTSSVFGAQVGGRGRAVSVTKHGDEVRIWELEGSTLISTSQARLSRNSETSVPATVENVKAQSELDSTVSTTKGWVGFDEENVIVLREKAAGRQTLAVYDFT